MLGLRERVRKVVMVTRTYPIRVGGTSGPMGIEIGAQKISDRSGLPVTEIDKTEVGTISGIYVAWRNSTGSSCAVRRC